VSISTLPPTRRPAREAPSRLDLRPYQHEALQAIVEAQAAGLGHALVVLPTGTGKTVLFNTLVSTWRVPTLIMAHREELLTQARDKLLAIWPDADVGIVGAGYNQPGHLVTIGSVQSLCKPRRIQALESSHIRLIIVDEAHHVAARSYRKVLKAVRAGEPGGAFHVGVTATPDRADGKSIVDATYGEPVYLASLPEMIRAGYLVNLRGVCVRTSTRLDGVHTRAGDFAEDELAALINRDDRNQQIVEAWQRHAGDRQTIAFCASVAHAQDLAESFRAAGVTAEALDAKTPREHRRDMLARVANGKLQVVCNCGVLTEGFDSPAVSCIVTARPTQSRALYVQCVGRGTRPAPGKTDCLILDVADVSTSHHLIVQSLPRLAGRTGYAQGKLEERANERSIVRAASGATFDMRDALESAPTTGRVIEQAVDLLDGFVWQASGDGNYSLPIGGKATFTLIMRDGAYEGVVVWPDGHRQELTSEPAPLDWAQTLCERAAIQVAQDHSHLVDRRAPWRLADPSEKQLYTLRRLRVRFNPATLTRGEAADLITAAFAGQQRSA